MLGGVFGEVIVPLAVWNEVVIEGDDRPGASDVANTSMDDRKGRRIARSLGVRVLGSAGVPQLAKDIGLIPAVTPVLNELMAAGLYLNEAARHEVIRIAGE